jgi:hypothetical protein
MRKILLLFIVVLSAMNVSAADYYWVNGGGQWSDLNHWRLGSPGGSIPSIVPSASDNVFFTNLSGFGVTVVTRTVSLDANGFCNNMTWALDVPNNPIFSRSNTAFKLEVWGNLSLAPSVNYQQSFVFKGGTTNSFTTNGTVDGVFAFEINKPSGTLNLVDSFVCPSTNTGNNILFTTGTFNIAGKVVKAYQFNSNNSGTRTLNATGASMILSNRWDFRGANKTLNAAGSNLSANSILAIDGSTYNVVSCNGLFDGDMVLSNATISKLTYTNVSTGSFATVSNNNTIDTVIFQGRGRIYNNNNIAKLTCQRTASILGSNNVIGTVNALDNFQVSSPDTTTVDSLLLAANHTSTLTGTININNYLRAQGITCEAFTELIANDSNTHVYFGASASALIDNVILSNIIAHGSITPISVSGVDGSGNIGFNITPPASLSGTSLYWIGGAGDWNDNTHWSYTSSGVGGACIPFIYDTVVFNPGSGLASGNIVTTSGNAYCHNISWLAGVGTSTFNKQPGTHFNIYGSAVLNPAVTMGNGANPAILEFVGNDSTSTIAFNGSTLGMLTITVNKADSGALTFTDNWSNVNGNVILTDGRINMPGRTINVRSITSNTPYATKYMNITNADIHVTSSWAYTGANNFLESNGSHIVSDIFFSVNNRYYPFVELTYAGASDVYNIAASSFGSLTFTSTSATSMAKVATGNTIRRLQFNGAGNITGNNNIDTLILAASRNYTFGGTTTLNKYLLAQSATCSGLLEMRGNTTGTFAFAPAATIAMANVYLQNMTATGVPPVAVSGADAGGNSGWNISSAAGTPRYWIGGSGDWNDANHWSTTSGGTGGACIPTVYDNVYFNANSGFTAVSKTVTVNNGNAYCRNLDWSAATNSPIWSKATPWTIEVWGDTVRLNAIATFTVSPLTFKGNTNAVMLGSALGNFDIRLQKPGGSLRLLNNYSNIQTDIYVNDGTLNLSGRTMSLSSINNEGLSNTMSINIAGADITLDTMWRYNGTAAAHTLVADSSTITTKTFLVTSLTYNNVNVGGILNTSAILSNATIDQLTFTDTNTASQIGVNGANNTIGTLDYKGGGGIYGTGNTINTLIFFPGNTYTLTNGTNTTITGEWYGSGTPCKLTEIVSSSPSANATVTKTSGSVEFDYVRLRRITAAGAAQPFSAQQHTIDQGGNVNWNIATYNGAAPIYGLGPDTALLATAFPHTLHTDGFFGVPSSQYIWNNSSTADSLVVADTGTYSVTVNFVDGCTISDAIHITLQTPLPVTLAGFAAHVQNCRAYLNWKVTDAINFSKFVVERSEDGRNFSSLAQIDYATGTQEYTYVDNGVGTGTSFYRLRLMDADGKFWYSTVRSVQLDCDKQAIQVYPTVTNGLVLINLPEAYAEAKIEVFTSLGQLLKLPVIGNANNAGLHNVHFGGLAQGQYLIKISNKGEAQTFKVLYRP